MLLSLLTDRRGDGVIVIAANGEIDLGGADELQEHLNAALENEAVHEIVLNVGGVSFLDSTGLGVLVKTRRRAEEAGKRFRVDGADGTVRQVLELTGLWTHLTSPTP